MIVESGISSLMIMSDSRCLLDMLDAQMTMRYETPSHIRLQQSSRTPHGGLFIIILSS